MTIEDAIRRAKILGQSRLQRQEAEAVPAAAERPAPRPVREPGLRFEPLQKVEISATACELHRALLTDAQLREFPAADAAYRLLRSRLANRAKRNNWSSLAIASPTPGDGKSITSVNLAISIAREKQRPVFLLDLDMRNPSVCQFLGVRDVRPLPDYFLGHARAEDVLFETSFPNLYLAGALAPTESASELLAGSLFGDLLAHIRLRSPDAVVLIDLPPVNVTDEALMIGPRVDAILVVVSEGKTQRVQLTKALNSLSEFTVAGVVINQSSESHTTAYDYYAA